jgi:hypothetical protein
LRAPPIHACGAILGKGIRKDEPHEPGSTRCEINRSRNQGVRQLSEVMETEETPAAGERPGTQLAERSSLGGRAVVEKYGRDHMSRLGRQGSNAVVRKYGLRFYSEIAARNKGVKKRRRPQEQAG